MLSIAVFIKSVPSNFVLLRDPNDAKYVDLALAAKTEYLVSRDTDLLDLMKPDSDLRKSFSQWGFEFKIIGPVEMLGILRAL